MTVPWPRACAPHATCGELMTTIARTAATFFTLHLMPAPPPRHRAASPARHPARSRRRPLRRPDGLGVRPVIVDEHVVASRHRLEGHRMCAAHPGLVAELVRVTPKGPVAGSEHVSRKHDARVRGASHVAEM